MVVVATAAVVVALAVMVAAAVATVVVAVVVLFVWGIQVMSINRSMDRRIRSRINRRNIIAEAI